MLKGFKTYLIYKFVAVNAMHLHIFIKFLLILGGLSPIGVLEGDITDTAG